MKIATFNINDVNRRLPNLLAWLREAEPDVACLQELKSTDAAFPAEAIRGAGYHAVWRGQRSWNGVAILSRTEPVLTRRSLPGDASDAQSRYIEAAVQGVLVGCLYLPNGNPQPGPKFAYKLAWLQPGAREAFGRLLGQGWTDAIRTRHPDVPCYTFWDHLRDRWARDAGLRIDHLLLSPDLADRLDDAGVDRDVRGAEGASDHAPAWVALRPAAARRRSRPRS